MTESQDALKPVGVNTPELVEHPPKRVYISNIAGYEFDNAKSYGELRYLTAGYVNLAAPNSILRKVYPKIRDASPDDFLLLTGSNALGAIIFMAWMKQHHKVNLLVFNRKKDGYIVLPLIDTEWEASSPKPVE